MLNPIKLSRKVKTKNEPQELPASRHLPSKKAQEIIDLLNAKQNAQAKKAILNYQVSSEGDEYALIAAILKSMHISSWFALVENTPLSDMLIDSHLIYMVKMLLRAKLKHQRQEDKDIFNSLMIAITKRKVLCQRMGYSNLIHFSFTKDNETIYFIKDNVINEVVKLDHFIACLDADALTFIAEKAPLSISALMDTLLKMYMNTFTDKEQTIIKRKLIYLFLNSDNVRNAMLSAEFGIVYRLLLNKEADTNDEFKKMLDERYHLWRFLERFDLYVEAEEKALENLYKEVSFLELIDEEFDDLLLESQVLAFDYPERSKTPPWEASVGTPNAISEVEQKKGLSLNI